MPQKTKEEKKEYQRLWYLKNKEKKNRQSRENYIKNWERDNARHRKWKEDNPNWEKNYGKKYRKENKEYTQNRHKEYSKSEQGKKTRRIATWKRSGLIADYEFVYNRYLQTNNCDRCYIELNMNIISNKHTKVMDHNHINGQFRGIMCNLCNLKAKDLRDYNFNLLTSAV
jgi:hypothetical protein